MVNMEGFSVVEEVLEAMGEDLEDYTVMEEILEEVVVVLVEVVVWKEATKSSWIKLFTITYIVAMN